MRARPLGSLLRRCADYSLPLCMVCTLAVIVGDLDAARWPARLALVVYLAAQWRRQSPLARGLLLTGLALAFGIAVLHTRPAPLLAHALDRFCFFATFVSALGMLRIAAMRSRLIRESGQALVRQRPTRRYPILALGTGLFGIIVNIGVLSLFGALIKRSNSLRAAGGHEWVRETRERRMMLAMLRGFALVPLTSPLSITMAVILSNMPALTWFDIAPVALPTGALVFGLGWLFDWLQRPAPSGLALPEAEAPSLAPFGRFVMLAGAITCTVFGVAAIGGIGLPVAVLIACPLSAFAWLALQRRRLGGGTGVGRAALLLSRHARLIFGANRIEIAVLGGSGFLGALVAPLVDTERLGDLLLASGLHGPAAAVTAMLVVTAFAQIGLNPIVTATLILGVLPEPATIGLHPVVLAAALMSAWALSMLSSPFTAVMLILSGLTGRSTYAITWRWNGAFFLLTTVALSLWLIALGLVMTPAGAPG
ncbi:hypothetical protein SAHL_09015 [Salinisphaera orenii YIM 95161]|uniref:H+/citrate symporter n=1 Tax=Salinisphaera orenii YIM 95161 TaxID=1051139 RepID=A0A423PV62_9GAMM|nr:hypothetical protein SAHL_09015 [Salinisphaera halophila YIM 95161]